MKRGTGFGGNFFKSENPEQISKWYKNHSAIVSESWGAQFNWRQLNDSDKTGYSVWSSFKNDTTYFEPS